MDNETIAFQLGGKLYTVDINAYTLGEVKKELGIDLLKCFEKPETFEQIAEPAALINCLRIFCKDCCVRNETDDDIAFAKLFKGGDILSEASECLLNAMILFFPSHQRTPLQKLMTHSRNSELKMKERAKGMMDSPTIEKLILQQQRKLDEQFTTALESLESQMQADEPSGS